MKKGIVILIVLLSVGMSYGQCGKKSKGKGKRITTGVNFGINKANALIEGNPSAVIENGLGFRLGVTSNLALTRRFSIEPKAELSFNTSSITEGGESIKIRPADLELMAHLKVKLLKGGFSPYLVIGPNVKVPLGNGALTMPTRDNLSIDLGIGLDVPLGRLKIAPELRYSYGLMNINRDSSIGDLKFHNVALILNIGGRPRF
ncbi:MAG: hypothetical protein ACI837_002796 [Crocinitomicaceae bacterium]|jgi:hypothetical protein